MKSLFTKEQRAKLEEMTEKIEAELMEKYGRLIYAAPPEELKRIEEEWTAHKKSLAASSTAAGVLKPDKK
jgi:translation initiation factor 2 alpha subunit (eIF-2alpha)